MTVRWKPLLAISGLFLVIGIMGLLAMVYALAPSNAPELLAKARKARAAHKLRSPRSIISARFRRRARTARFTKSWARCIGNGRRPFPTRRNRRSGMQATASFAEAARRGKNLVEPRRVLLAEALPSAASKRLKSGRRSWLLSNLRTPTRTMCSPRRSLTRRPRRRTR